MRKKLAVTVVISVRTLDESALGVLYSGFTSPCQEVEMPRCADRDPPGSFWRGDDVASLKAVNHFDAGKVGPRKSERVNFRALVLPPPHSLDFHRGAIPIFAALNISSECGV